MRASAEGAWITDVEGRRYLDCLAAYSAVNFGHHNDEIVAADAQRVRQLHLAGRGRLRSDGLCGLAERRVPGRYRQHIRSVRAGAGEDDDWRDDIGLRHVAKRVWKGLQTR